MLYQIRDLRRIRPLLDFSTAHAIGTLDYCNSLYCNLPKIQLNRLQHIQNSLARAVVAAPRSSSPDQILKSLHWLKVQEYKIISTTYKLLQFSSQWISSQCQCQSMSLPPSLHDLLTLHLWSPSFILQFSRELMATNRSCSTSVVEKTSPFSPHSISVGSNT